MAARDTVMSWWWARCQPMVSGPESSRVAVSLCRSSKIRSTTSLGIAVGEDCGRRDTVSPTKEPALTCGNASQGRFCHLNPRGLFRTYSPSIRVVLGPGRVGELL